MTDQADLVEILSKFLKKKTRVEVSIPDANLCFHGDLMLTWDSRLIPPHRLSLHDYKGNTILLNLNDKRLGVYPVPESLVIPKHHILDQRWPKKYLEYIGKNFLLACKKALDAGTRVHVELKDLPDRRRY